MCTVTFIPTDKANFVLTSNRDEAPFRETLLPDFYVIDKTRMLFPKDKIAGGTWIGLSDKKRLVCLLNGGYQMHERKAEYRMSRGVVVKDMLSTTNVQELATDYDLKGVEPFTLIIIEWHEELKVHELVWDGVKKHFSVLPNEPRLWSSASLYNDQMKAERQGWFKMFLKNQDLSAKAIKEFHKTGGEDNEEYGTIMDRGFVKTTSLTQIEKANDAILMDYSDLVTKKSALKNFEIPQVVNEK